MIQYDDHADRTEAAFNAYVRIYKLTVPPPAPPSVRRSINWTMIFLSIVTVAAVLVSGDRTVDEFGGIPKGLVAFIMLEVAAIIISFILTKLMPDGAHSKKLLWVTLIIIVFIMVGANIHSVARFTGIYITPAILTTILMMVAISAPILTAINGHLTAVEWKANKREQQHEWHEYEARLARWRTDLNKQWEQSREYKSTALRIERAEKRLTEPPSVRSLNDVNERSEQTKNMGGRQAVREWFSEHPDRVNDTVDTLWADFMNDTGIKVGRGTVYNVQVELRGANRNE